MNRITISLCKVSFIKCSSWRPARRPAFTTGSRLPRRTKTIPYWCSNCTFHPILQRLECKTTYRITWASRTLASTPTKPRMYRRRTSCRRNWWMQTINLFILKMHRAHHRLNKVRPIIIEGWFKGRIRRGSLQWSTWPIHLKASTSNKPNSWSTNWTPAWKTWLTAKPFNFSRWSKTKTSTFPNSRAFHSSQWWLSSQLFQFQQCHHNSMYHINTNNKSHEKTWIDQVEISTLLWTKGRWREEAPKQPIRSTFRINNCSKCISILPWI